MRRVTSLLVCCIVSTLLSLTIQSDASIINGRHLVDDSGQHLMNPVRRQVTQNLDYEMERPYVRQHEPDKRNLPHPDYFQGEDEFDDTDNYLQERRSRRFDDEDDYIEDEQEEDDPDDEEEDDDEQDRRRAARATRAVASDNTTLLPRKLTPRYYSAARTLSKAPPSGQSQHTARNRFRPVTSAFESVALSADEDPVESSDRREQQRKELLPDWQTHDHIRYPPGISVEPVDDSKSGRVTGGDRWRPPSRWNADASGELESGSPGQLPGDARIKDDWPQPSNSVDEVATPFASDTSDRHKDTTRDKFVGKLLSKNKVKLLQQQNRRSQAGSLSPGQRWSPLRKKPSTVHPMDEYNYEGELQTFAARDQQLLRKNTRPSGKVSGSKLEMTKRRPLTGRWVRPPSNNIRYPSSFANRDKQPETNDIEQKSMTDDLSSPHNSLNGDDVISRLVRRLVKSVDYARQATDNSSQPQSVNNMVITLEHRPMTPEQSKVMHARREKLLHDTNNTGSSKIPNKQYEDDLPFPITVEVHENTYLPLTSNVTGPTSVKPSSVGPMKKLTSTSSRATKRTPGHISAVPKIIDVGISSRGISSKLLPKIELNLKDKINNSSLLAMMDLKSKTATKSDSTLNLTDTLETISILAPSSKPILTNDSGDILAKPSSQDRVMSDAIKLSIPWRNNDLAISGNATNDLAMLENDTKSRVSVNTEISGNIGDEPNSFSSVALINPKNVSTEKLESLTNDSIRLFNITSGGMKPTAILTNSTRISPIPKISGVDQKKENLDLVNATTFGQVSQRSTIPEDSNISKPQNVAVLLTKPVQKQESGISGQNKYNISIEDTALLEDDTTEKAVNPTSSERADSVNLNRFGPLTGPASPKLWSSAPKNAGNQTEINLDDRQFPTKFPAGSVAGSVPTNMDKSTPFVQDPTAQNQDILTYSSGMATPLIHKNQLTSGMLSDISALNSSTIMQILNMTNISGTTRAFNANVTEVNATNLGLNLGLNADGATGDKSLTLNATTRGFIANVTEVNATNLGLNADGATGDKSLGLNAMTSGGAIINSSVYATTFPAKALPHNISDESNPEKPNPGFPFNNGVLRASVEAVNTTTGPKPNVSEVTTSIVSTNISNASLKSSSASANIPYAILNSSTSDANVSSPEETGVTSGANKSDSSGKGASSKRSVSHSKEEATTTGTTINSLNENNVTSVEQNSIFSSTLNFTRRGPGVLGEAVEKPNKVHQEKGGGRLGVFNSSNIASALRKMSIRISSSGIELTNQSVTVDNNDLVTTTLLPPVVKAADGGALVANPGQWRAVSDFSSNKLTWGHNNGMASKGNGSAN